MNKKSLRTGVVIFTLITALIHLVMLNISIYNDKGSIDILFTLNGLGYFAFLAAFLDKLPFLKGKEKLIHYGFIGYALVTIIAYFALSGSGPLGLLTKADELLLVIFVYLHFQKTE